MAKCLREVIGGFREVLMGRRDITCGHGRSFGALGKSFLGL